MPSITGDLHYITKMNIFSEQEDRDALPLILSEIQKWIEEKEERRAQRKTNQKTLDLRSTMLFLPGSRLSTKSASLIQAELVSKAEDWISKKGYRESSKSGAEDEETLFSVITEDIINWKKEYGTVNKDTYVSKSFANGEFVYQGNDTFLMTKAILSEDGNSIKYWAMEYEEPDSDSKNWWRSWITQIGISKRADGYCDVVIRTTYKINSVYMKSSYPFPMRNVPKIVRMIMGLEDLLILNESKVMTDNPIRVSAQLYPQFLNYLEDPKRKMPIVAIASDKEGVFTIDYSSLVKDFQGLTCIYLFDLSDPELNSELNTWNDEHKAYALSPSMLRIYQPSIDYEDNNDGKRHRWYFNSDIQRQTYSKWCNDIMSGLVRTNAEGIELSRPVISIADIDRRIKDARRDALAIELANRKTKEEREEARKAAAEQLNSFLDKFINSQKSSKQPDEDIQELKKNYDNLLQEIQEKDKEIDSLNGMLEIKEEDLNEAMTLAQDYERQYQELKRDSYAAKAASYEYDTLVKDRQSLQGKADALDNLEALPSTPLEALLMAKEVFSDKLIVLDEAIKTAKEASKGNQRSANEVWQIMRSLYLYYYPACMKEIEYSGSLEDYFTSNSGYEMALREGKLTKGNDSYNTVRTMKYKDEKVVLRTHVKGRCDDPGKDLRIYLFADHDDKKVVIGYCGKHPETAGSKRRGF